MAWLYHRVPRDMRGTVLHPLNVLVEFEPELAAQYKKKYYGRTHVAEQRIPPLDNCLWNDVLFLSAVHPRVIVEALISVGLEPAPLETYRAYQIDSCALDPKITAILPYEREGVFLGPRDFVPYDPSSIEQCSVLPERTLAHYRAKKAAGLRPLLYAFVPHILYKGSIDVSELPIVEVSL